MLQLELDSASTSSSSSCTVNTVNIVLLKGKTRGGQLLIFTNRLLQESSETLKRCWRIPNARRKQPSKSSFAVNKTRISGTKRGKINKGKVLNKVQIQ